tara:strand:- start:5064 stop:6488 length:1425 start_codon:yes stop_codon:yes gene_type:complete
MSVKNLNEISKMFSDNGVRVIYFKHLAKKVDNDKNQISLGSSIKGLGSLFKSKTVMGNITKSTRKKYSKKESIIYYGLLDFYWILPNGKKEKAPKTKIINYLQYSKDGEARLSGFVSGSPNSPPALRRTKQERFGHRILCLGSNDLGEVYGYVLTEKDDKIVDNFPELPKHDSIPLLEYISTHNLKLENKQIQSPRNLLLEELREIYNAGWHDSVRMKSDGSVIPYRANNGGGYTLEALLGIKPNALKKPDKYGFEIKSYGATSNARISLMTPTPDEGDAGELSFSEFMIKHGWKSRSDDYKFVFTGPFKESLEKIYSKEHNNYPNSMTLLLNGYDDHKGIWVDQSKINISLVKKNYQSFVAMWSLQKLISSWEEKHAQAIYVCRQRNSKNQYKFSSNVYICTGTSIWKLLEATKKRIVCFDPAHDVYLKGHKKHPKGKENNRPQWRISASKSKLKHNLEALYETVETVDLKLL